MSSNEVLVASSLLILAATFIFGHHRWSRLSVVDVYVIAVGIFFGGTTLVDGLVKNLSMSDPYLAALVVFLITLTVGLTWLAAILLSPKSQNALNMRYLMTQWARIDDRIILLSLALVLIFQAYGYMRFGLISYINNRDLSTLGLSLPYWYTSALQLVMVLTFCLALAVTSKVFSSQRRLFWVIVLVPVLGLAALYGRRSIFLVLIMFLVLWSFSRGKNLFSLRSVPMIVIVLALLFVASNVFQSYRSNILSSSAKALGVSAVPGFLDATRNTDATLSNLERRQSVWEFDYTILQAQERDIAPDIPYGGILLQGLENAVPSALLPEKSVRDLDAMTGILYSLGAKDFASNDYTHAQADFGYLSLLVLPLMYLFIFASMAVAIRLTVNYPVLLLLLSGLFLYHLLNVEKNYGAVFVLYRNAFVIVAGYMAVYLAFVPLAKKRYSIVWHQKVTPDMRPLHRRSS